MLYIGNPKLQNKELQKRILLGRLIWREGSGRKRPTSKPEALPQSLPKTLPSDRETMFFLVTRLLIWPLRSCQHQSAFEAFDLFISHRILLSFDLSQEGGTHKFFHWGWSAHQRESQPFPSAWERRFLAINQWHLRPGWEGNVEHLYEEVPVWESWLIFQNPWYLQSHLSIFPSGCLSMHMSKYSSTSWKNSLNFMWLKKSSGAPHR